MAYECGEDATWWTETTFNNAFTFNYKPHSCLCKRGNCLQSYIQVIIFTALLMLSQIVYMIILNGKRYCETLTSFSFNLWCFRLWLSWEVSTPHYKLLFWPLLISGYGIDYFNNEMHLLILEAILWLVKVLF